MIINHKYSTPKKLLKKKTQVSTPKMVSCPSTPLGERKYSYFGKSVSIHDNK